MPAPACPHPQVSSYNESSPWQAASFSNQKETSMFNIIKGLAKAAVGVATLPVDILADTVTLGGVLADRKEPYTASKARKIMRALDEATD